MPRHRPMTMVEWLIAMAILGILASIVLPSLQQASRRTQGRTAAGAPAEPTPPDGQLNVIEPPEASEISGGAASDQDGRALGPALWIALAVVTAFVMFRRIQRRGSRGA